MSSLFTHTFSIFLSCFFFFNSTATTEIYTLSLHDALPICTRAARGERGPAAPGPPRTGRLAARKSLPESGHPRPLRADRKSTRLNSSHMSISYAVFCLKKKIKIKKININAHYNTRHLTEPQ